MTDLASRKTAPKTAKRLVETRRTEIAALDDEFMGEVVGVSQAIGEMRKALDQVRACLDRREFEKASALGYGAVSSAFVFLQRTLGGLQHVCTDKEKLVCDMAYQLRQPYEEILPHVNAVMKSPHPLTEEERRNRPSRAQIRAKVKAIIGKTKRTA